jgi:hypothetical protein
MEERSVDLLKAAIACLQSARAFGCGWADDKVADACYDLEKIVEVHKQEESNGS